MNYTEHVCKDTDEMGDPYRPDAAQCGHCKRYWCAACEPTPASLCPFCCASGTPHAIPPRQGRYLFGSNLPALDPWQRRPRY